MPKTLDSKLIKRDITVAPQEALITIGKYIAIAKYCEKDPETLVDEVRGLPTEAKIQDLLRMEVMVEWINDVTLMLRYILKDEGVDATLAPAKSELEA